MPERGLFADQGGVWRREEAKVDRLEEARRELAIKTRNEIEEETAYKWAARAVAAIEVYLTDGGLRWRLDAEHYLDEAFEHGALADGSGRVLAAVREWVRQNTPTL